MKNKMVIKNKLFCILMIALLFTSTKAFSQKAELPREKGDIIMKDGNQIANAGLWEVHSGLLVYELEGSLHDALIADIERIRMPEADYIFSATNSLEKVNVDSLSNTDSTQTTKEDSVNVPEDVSTGKNYIQGVKDAEKYYDGAGAAFGGFFSGMIPGLGWFVMMPIISASKPQMYNADNPNVAQLADKDYQAGYKKKATNKKLGNFFGGFSLGLTTFLLLVL